MVLANTAESQAAAVTAGQSHIQACWLTLLQAVEASQFAKMTNFAMLRNTMSKPLQGLVFKVESWGGGLVEGGGRLVSGQFR